LKEVLIGEIRFADCFNVQFSAEAMLIKIHRFAAIALEDQIRIYVCHSFKFFVCINADLPYKIIFGGRRTQQGLKTN
jgi:hypothetical protein